VVTFPVISKNLKHAGACLIALIGNKRENNTKVIFNHFYDKVKHAGL
jgi:hypothetical protein